MSTMAFYTQDEKQLNKLFCGSKLSRDKWDREDYGTKTLEKAISGLTEVYDPENKGASTLKNVYSPDILKNIHVPKNGRERLHATYEFIKGNLMSLSKSEANAIIITDIKEHFHLSRDEITNIKQFYKEEANKRHDIHAELSNNWNTDLEIDKEFEGLYTVQWNAEKTKVIDILLHFDNIAMKALDAFSTISYKGQLYVYHTDGYYDDSEEIVMQEITRIINGIRKGRFSSGIKNCSSNVLHNIQYFNPVTEYPFNKENAAIPVKNGIVLLDFENKTKTLIPPSPDYKFNYIIPTEYKEDEDPKPIDDILKQYAPEQIRDLYQYPAQGILQMLGYGPFKKAYLWQGSHDAGKSSYIELIRRTFANYCDVSLDMLNPKENKFALSSLDGKIFNIHDDMTFFSMKDTGTFKNLTGSYFTKSRKRGNSDITRI